MRHSLAAADRVGCHFTIAYDLIRRFSESGFDTFDQASDPKGRLPILHAKQLRELVEVALPNLQKRGLRSPTGRCRNSVNAGGRGVFFRR